jgi:hypothetical protein
MTSAGPNGLLGVCMGTQFADYASGYPLEAGVLAADRVSPIPGRRSLLHGPFGPKQAATTDDTAPGTGEKPGVRQP